MTLLSVVLLSGCGGGGAGDPEPPARSSSDSEFVAAASVEGVGGTIEPASLTLPGGTSGEFSLLPDPDYQVESVAGCGGSLMGSTYVVQNLTEDCSVTASFVELGVGEVVISTLVNEGGAISPPSATIEAGDSMSFELAVNEGYVVESISGCGGQLAGVIYNLDSVQNDCTIEVQFGEKPVVTDALPDVSIYELSFSALQQGLAWGNDRWVVTTTNPDRVLVSENNGYFKSYNSDNTRGGRLLWDGSRFISYGAGIAISEDGSNWTPLVELTYEDFTALIWTGEFYVATNGYMVYRSEDLITWSSIDYFVNEHTSRTYTLFWTGDTILFGDSDAKDYIYKSIDQGLTWVRSEEYTENFSDFFRVDDTLIGLGHSDGYHVSKDGLNWQLRTITTTNLDGIENKAVIRKIIKVKDGYIGLSLQSKMPTAGSTAVYFSENLTEWSQLDIGYAGTFQDAYVNPDGEAMFFGDDVFYSRDGQDWNIRLFGDLNLSHRGYWSLDRYVVVSNGRHGLNSILVSTDQGWSWRRHVIGKVPDLEAATWTGSHYVVTGSEGNVYLSSDGNKWKSPDTGVTTRLSTITSYKNNLIASGHNAIITSVDGGESWSAYYHQNGLAWEALVGNDRIVLSMAGSIQVMVSTDSGETWQTESLLPSLGYPFWNSNNQLFYNFAPLSNVGGEVYTSADAVNWALLSSYEGELIDVDVLNDGTFVGISQGGLNQQSLDGSVWEKMQPAPLNRSLYWQIATSGESYLIHGGTNLWIGVPTPANYY